MRLKSPFLIKLGGRLSAGLLKLIFRSLRRDILLSANVRPYDNDGPDRYLFSVWHDSAILAAFGGRHAQTVALTSRHRDGSFVESIVGSVGVRSVRGSTGKGGQRAARQLLEVAKTHDIVMTPDGPRGPRRELSSGIVFLASKTGNPIVPTAYACENAWEIPGSWTTQTVPKPFSRAIFMAGDPIRVPADLSREEIEAVREQAQLAMDELQNEANALLSHNAQSDSSHRPHMKRKSTANALAS